MAKRLIDVEPTTATPIPTGHLFRFGDIELGERFGMVYLTSSNKCYIVYRLMLGTDETLEFQHSRRDLTPEEIEHFTKLAKQVDRELNREEHQQQRATLEQQQNALIDATNGRVLM